MMRHCEIFSSRLFSLVPAAFTSSTTVNQRNRYGVNQQPGRHSTVWKIKISTNALGIRTPRVGDTHVVRLKKVSSPVK
jgi:hypothetical protein